MALKRPDEFQVSIEERTVEPSNEVHYQFATFTHEYIREYIRLADQKSAFVFGASAAVLAFLYKSSVPQNWIALPESWKSGQILALVTMVLLAVAGVLGISVIKPRRGGPRSGLIFWDAVVDRPSSSDYCEAVLESSPNDLVEEYLKHTYDLAEVCRAKYDVLQRSFWAFLIGLVLATIYFVFFAPIQH